MKPFLLTLLLLSTAAQADVNYVAIGRTLHRGETKLRAVREVLDCVTKAFTPPNQTCPVMETMDTFFFDLLSEDGRSVYVAPFECLTDTLASVGELKQAAAEARDLARDATPADPVFDRIARYEGYIRDWAAYAQNAVRSTKLQELYLANCLF
jgi:hypothetical protein